jgi:cytochrome c oxidase subunit 2
MFTKIAVLPQGEFNKWYQAKKQEVALKGPLLGPKLYQEKGCFACHSIDGTPRVGPSFKGLLGKTERVLTAGKERSVVVDEAYIRKYISEPNFDVIEGFQPIMPKVSLTEDELNALVEFIKSLKG